MRKLLISIALVVPLALAGPAAAKEMSVSLANAPTGSKPGDEWTAQLLVHGEPALLKQAAPSVTIRGGPDGRKHTFPAKPTGKRAADGQLVYEAVVVFPTGGTWVYELSDGFSDRTYEGGSVSVRETGSQSAPAASGDETGASAVWPFALGAALFFAAAGGVVVLKRRVQPTA